jgi:glucose-1-phosphate thymidylyltransferase
MKAVIPTAGVGSRLRPHTHTIPKALIQVAGKPILGYILDEIKALSIEEIVLVIGYMGEKVMEYVDNNYDFKVSYVEQSERKGLGHAIYLTKDYISDEPILIILGDTIFKADFKQIMNSPYNSIGVKKVSDPRRFGIVELSGDFISNLVEKPDLPPTDLAIVGIYYINTTQSLFASLEKIIKEGLRTKGEEKITTFEVEGWFDCGEAESLLATNRYLLELKHTDYELEGSIVRPPVFISPYARIDNSIIGPYVSIAGGSVITDSIITDTIINENAKVEHILLRDSLIGDNAEVSGNFYKLNVGDSSEIKLR